jgi:hypothetical protein
MAPPACTARSGSRSGDGDSVTSLAQIVAHLDEAGPDALMFVEPPWHADSRAAVVAHDAETTRVDGLRYFLEVDLAREVLQVWSAWRDGRKPSLDDAVVAIIYYAQRDAFLPVD